MICIRVAIVVGSCSGVGAVLNTGVCLSDGGGSDPKGRIFAERVGWRGAGCGKFVRESRAST